MNKPRTHPTKPCEWEESVNQLMLSLKKPRWVKAKYTIGLKAKGHPLLFCPASLLAVKENKKHT